MLKALTGIIRAITAINRRDVILLLTTRLIIRNRPPGIFYFFIKHYLKD